MKIMIVDLFIIFPYLIFEFLTSYNKKWLKRTYCNISNEHIHNFFNSNVE